jgi:two-component system, LytTR family, response regulator
MKPMKTLLVDDEPSARLRLRRLLEGDERLEIAAECADGLSAVQEMEQLKPDLVFLDVQMPGLDGFEILRALPKSVPRPLVIFVTGFHEHALRAFEANAVAYLLKPIETERLEEMVERSWRLHSFSDGRADQDRVDSLIAADARGLERIVARKLDRLFLLEPSQIFYFFIDNGIVRAKTANETFWVNYQMGELEEGLAKRDFFRVHRGRLVNLKHVREIRPDVRSSFLLIMDDSSRTGIEVSERQGRLLRDRIPGL